MSSFDWKGHVLDTSDHAAFADAVELATENRLIELFKAEQAKCLEIALYANGPELLEQARILHAGLSHAIDIIQSTEEQK